MATRTLIITFALLTAACGDVDPLGSGSMALHWRVSPNGCESAGVEVVEVRATGPHAVVERFGCSRESAILEGMTPGTYRVELHGFDANGEGTFVSEAQAVDVDADTTAVTPTMRLLAAPASVDVRWSFSNGRVCGANGVRRVTIGVFDEYDYEVATAQFECDSGEGPLPELRAGSYLVEVNALDAHSSIVWRGTAPIKVARADELVVDVQLEPAE